MTTSAERAAKRREVVAKRAAANTLVYDRPQMWEVCDDCNYCHHRCHFCGDDLTHNQATLGAKAQNPHPCYVDNA